VWDQVTWQLAGSSSRSGESGHGGWSPGRGEALGLEGSLEGACRVIGAGGWVVMGRLTIAASAASEPSVQSRPITSFHDCHSCLEATTGKPQPSGFLCKDCPS
jgi:hypothetical protein